MKLKQEIKEVALDSAIKIKHEEDYVDSLIATEKKIEDYLSTS